MNEEMKVLKFLKKKIYLAWLIIVVLFLFSFIIFGLFFYKDLNIELSNLNQWLNESILVSKDLKSQLDKASFELSVLKQDDQYLKNKQLEEEIKNIHNTYLKAVGSYEKILDLRSQTSKTIKFEELLAYSLKLLADKNYSSAEAVLVRLDQQMEEERGKLASLVKIPENVLSANAPPGSGYRRQKVNIDSGEFLVDIVAADLNSTRVIVDTASDSDCADNCPTLALADYVSRNGAFAGVNGSYFCPSTYPQCANKKNSFDTLLMNKNKRYFNSDNNVYSTIPAVIFSGNSARFVQRSLEWGRDTSIDAVIANHPLLVFNNALVFGGDGDAKHNNKGGRSFVGVTGNMVYIGVVRSATVLESAKVLFALGIHNALNLDDGGSTALWSSGYKAGPGRGIPNAILLIRR